jgi:hypothetical protein
MTRLQKELQIMTPEAVLASPESAEPALARSLMVGRFAGVAELADQFLRNIRLDDQESIRWNRFSSHSCTPTAPNKPHPGAIHSWPEAPNFALPRGKRGSPPYGRKSR